MRNEARSPLLLDLAFLASGFAALGYELLWTRLLGLQLGSEMLAVMAVLAAFFGGMALGSALLHGVVRRSARPALLFALFEFLAALFALASPWLLPAAARWLPMNTGVALILPAATLLLLPATLPMGATLAALVEARRRARSEAAGRNVGTLYALNTAGAALGVLTCVHLLQPRLGLDGSAFLLAAIGIAAGLAALIWERGRVMPPEAETPAASGGSLELLLLFLGGAAGIGLELVGVRVLGQVMKGTVYTFASVLAIYLLGTALGAALYGRFLAARLEKDRGGILPLALAMLAAAWLSGLVMAGGGRILDRLVEPSAPATRWVMAEGLLAAAAFLPATLVMGALFARLLSRFRDGGVGRPYALNTLGAVIAPFLLGPGALATWGYRGALRGVLVVYGAIALLAAWHSRRRPLALGAAVLLLLATYVLTPSNLVLVDPPSNWRLVEMRESLHGTVLVSESKLKTPGLPATRRLQVGRHYAMGGGLSFGERRMGHLPLLLAPDAKRLLFLGVGTGATLGAAKDHPADHVLGVELVPEVLDLLPRFHEVNERIWRDPRVELRAGDARHLLSASARGEMEAFDLIVADLFHPARDGAAFLYSREHFAAGAEALAPGGRFAQWLPLYQLDVEGLRLILRGFLDVFPDTHAWLGLYNAGQPNLLLVGRVPGGAPADVETMMRRLAPDRLAASFVAGGADLLGGHLCGAEALAEWAGDGPRNLDLKPRLLFRAPIANYGADPRRGARLLAELLPLREPVPATLLGGDAVARDSLLAVAGSYGEAMGRFMRADVDRVLHEEMRPDDTVVRGYLEAYALDPSFIAARGALMHVAAEDPSRAVEIYEGLIANGPMYPWLIQSYRRALTEEGRPERYREFLAELWDSTD